MSDEQNQKSPCNFNRLDVVRLVGTKDMDRIGIVLGVDERREHPYRVRLVPEIHETHETVVRVGASTLRKVYAHHWNYNGCACRWDEDQPSVDFVPPPVECDYHAKIRKRAERKVRRRG